jgi:hypothetical protein
MAADSLNMEVEHKEYFFSNHLSKTLVNPHQVEYINIIENEHNEIRLESIGEGGVKDEIRRIIGAHSPRRDRLFLFLILKFGDLNWFRRRFEREANINCQFLLLKFEVNDDKFVEALIKFLIRVLFGFILKLVIYGFLCLIFRNFSSNLQNCFSFRNPEKFLYHSFTDDSLWIIEPSHPYDMRHFLRGIENLF